MAELLSGGKPWRQCREAVLEAYPAQKRQRRERFAEVMAGLRDYGAAEFDSEPVIDLTTDPDSSISANVDGEADAPTGEDPDSEANTVAVGSDALVNINTAGIDELRSLSGIGPRKAEAIIAYREQNGPFAAAGDLEQVRGIGARTMERLLPLITVE